MFSKDLLKHTVKWMAGISLDRIQMVNIRKKFSTAGLPNGGIPQRTLLGPKFLDPYVN